MDWNDLASWEGNLAGCVIHNVAHHNANPKRLLLAKEALDKLIAQKIHNPATSHPFVDGYDGVPDSEYYC